MTERTELADAGQIPERFSRVREYQLGTWVWVSVDCEDGEESQDPWLGCITHVGSNFVKVTEPGERGTTERVHFEMLIEKLEIEPDAESVLKGFTEESQVEVQKLLEDVRKVTANLGLGMHEQTTALATVASSADVKEYKNALVKAEEETLPELFKKLKDANRELVRWASASVLPVLAMTGKAEKVVDEIKDRVFTIELYAGLLEDVTCLRKGEPAAMNERLRIMQRRCYMDEECLIGYRTGGVDINDLEGFDEWLCEDENMNRILPFERCMVAFQVRRNVKHREWDGTLSGVFVKMHMDQSDKLTFLYIRNGDRIYRMNTEIEFDYKLFPDKDELVLEDKMWGKVFGGKDVITDGHYQDMLSEQNEKKRLSDEWEKNNPDGEYFDNPHRHWDRYLERDYEPYDPSSVYFDDIDKRVKDKIRDYNRIAYVVQGLMDRSEVLHPHPQAKLWSREGFEQLVELVYDADRVLNPSAEPPDFEAYRLKCNESLGPGSITVGQDDFWQKREAVKYNDAENRRIYSSRYSHHDVVRHVPYGNPGPGFVARIARWAKRKRTATFEWERKRRWSENYWDNYGRGGKRKSETIKTLVTVPASKLFNISAYKPGDYKVFFADLRTRSDYMVWVEMLLAAEEYHAGNLDLNSSKVKKLHVTEEEEDDGV